METTTPSIYGNIYDQKFRVAIGTMGAVGLVIWASMKGKKGKFWWFVGGGLAGGAIGYLIDSYTAKK